jgi:methyl-accepting chemotaxis protein
VLGLKLCFCQRLDISLVVVFSLVLFKIFTRPNRILSDDMDRMRAADFDKSIMQKVRKPWKRESHNEVHRLGCAFNDMLEHFETL